MPSRLEDALPHRPPFLLLDEITAVTDVRIEAVTVLRPDDELWSRVYAGHYPGRPITPGVLLCEMILQAAAILAGRLAAKLGIAGLPMVTRIRDAKFKSPVFPGDRVEISAELEERLANAFFMRGRVGKNGKTAVDARFAVSLAPEIP